MKNNLEKYNENVFDSIKYIDENGEDILDNMGSDELIANLLRITQTEQKLKNDNIQKESDANSAHFKVGCEVRNIIKRLGGTVPECLPTPKKSLKRIEKERKIK